MSGPNGSVAANGSVPTIPPICHELRRKLLAFLEEKTDDKVLRNVQSRSRDSIAVIEKALRTYTLDQLSLSYNGGKDCLVLLILLLACLPILTPEPETTSETATTEPALQAIYIVSKDPFPEVESFVAASASAYHLDLSRYSMGMKAALEAYIADRPRVRAVFMGTRRTDPHGATLDDFAPTDGDWPQIMRVHPVLDWHYVEIWGFIRRLDIPFCCLYNQGFTSLGGIKDTKPNPALAIGSSTTEYRPAYELVHDEEERLGRDR